MSAGAWDTEMVCPHGVSLWTSKPNLRMSSWTSARKRSTSVVATAFVIATRRTAAAIVACATSVGAALAYPPC